MLWLSKERNCCRFNCATFRLPCACQGKTDRQSFFSRSRSDQRSSLELRHYKNDSIQSKTLPILKLPCFFSGRVAEWKSAAHSKLATFLTELSCSYIILALEKRLRSDRDREIWRLRSCDRWSQKIVFSALDAPPKCLFSGIFSPKMDNIK